MQRYLIKEGLVKMDAGESTQELSVILMNHGEVSTANLEDSMKRRLHLEQGIRFCKVEEARGFLVGMMYVPSHSGSRSHISFRYLIEKNQVIFIDDSGQVKQILDRMSESHSWTTPGIGTFFADFLENLILNDTVFVTELEKKLEQLEDIVLEKGAEDDFNHKISGYRRKIMLFSHYYLQLSDMGNLLEEDHNHIFQEEELHSLELFVTRVGRLREEMQMLRDYSVQIREIYQSRVDEHQNEIMKVLTIVTTIFLPLTLIAGWYGMNFTNMPELSWSYGYPVIIIVSAVVIVLCMWLFRKKKFW